MCNSPKCTHKSHPEAVREAGLVTVRKSVDTKGKKPRKSGKSSKYFLQEKAAALLPNESIKWCSKHLAFRSDGKVHVKGGPHGSSFTGLARCGSVWVCPICSPRISMQRSHELERAIDLHTTGGFDVVDPETGEVTTANAGVVIMLTLTARHDLNTDLEQFLTSFLAAEKRMKQRRGWRGLKTNWMRGSVRALEVTWGKRNGWHPHSHSLLFFEGVSELKAMELVEELRGVWSECLAAVGLDCNEVGFHVQNGDKAAAYVAKFGRAPKDPDSLWGAAQELTMSHHKKPKKGEEAEANLKGREPFQILADAADGDKQSSALFVEYARVFKGRRQLTWSPGLKARFQIEEATDEELAAEDEKDGGNIIASIEFEDWKAICKTRLRGAVLDAADADGADGVGRVIEEARGLLRERERRWREAA